MRLIITEKPSMGRDIAAALKVTKKAEGYLEGPNDIVTWCIGHLVELAEPEVYDAKFQKWRIEDLPILPERFKYQPNSKTVKQYKIIKELLSRNDITKVVNACDAGREGELIFDLVYTLSKCRKPVERLWLSSLTVDEIIKGFQNLKPAKDYQGLRDSAYARQQADWLVGINSTRVFTIKAKFAGQRELFSLGRVQTPTLAIIVQRDQEILNFKPTTYYQVRAHFQAQAGEYYGLWFNSKGNRLDKLETAQALAQKVLGRPGLIEKVEKKAYREKSPLLYDLTALQRAANARFGFSAAQTLELAQSLYEKKFITYPRTSSRHLSSGVAAEIKQHLSAVNFGPYAGFVNTILNSGNTKLSSRYVDDKKVTDHHAIICTKLKVDPSSLQDNEKRIYDIIVRRFLAAFFPDAELERTTIITAVENEKFVTKGTQVLKPGWRVVDPPGREDRRKTDDDEEESDNLPAVQSQNRVQTLNAEALTKQTKAPPRYSEASLLAAMESAGKQIEDEDLRLAMKDSGLGTPATRASIIETLLKREYVERDKKALHATEKGIALINLLPSNLLKSAELTGMWEKKLADISNNSYSLQNFMKEVESMIAALVKEIGQAQLKLELTQRSDDQEDRSDKQTSRQSNRQTSSDRPHKQEQQEDSSSDESFPCPKCAREGRKGNLVERKSDKGKFIVCSLGRDLCGYIGDLPKNAKQRKAIAQAKCPNCQGAMRLRLPKEKDKKPVLLCLNYSTCKGVCYFDEKGSITEAKPKAETGPACKVCGAHTVKRGPFKTKSGESYFWGCSNWKRDGGCNAQPIWIN